MIKKQKLEHSPTLNTILMVERTLKKTDKSVITIAELKHRLPKQISHNTSMLILDYLEKSNKIVVTLKGIAWIHNTNQNLRLAISRGLELWSQFVLYSRQRPRKFTIIWIKGYQGLLDNSFSNQDNRKVPDFVSTNNKKVIIEVFYEYFKIRQ